MNKKIGGSNWKIIPGISGERCIVLLGVVVTALFLTTGAGAEITIRGRVADADGRPLANARVELCPLLGAYEDGRRLLAGGEPPAPLRRLVSGADGRFEIAAPEIGLWQLKVSAAGRVPMARFFTPLFKDADTGVVGLPVARTVEAVVKAINGTPVAGAVLRVRAALNQNWPSFPEGTWVRAEELRATNAEGRVLLRWDAEESSTGESLTVHVRRPGFLDVFYRDVSGHVDAKSGTLTVRLEPDPGHVLRVLGAEGEPMPGVLLFGLGHPLGFTGEDGTVRLTDWDLRGSRLGLVVATDHGPRVERLELREGQDTIRLENALTVRGRVMEMGSERPMAGALVWQTGVVASVARTDAQGRFEWPLATTESWRLVAAAAGFAPESADRSQAEAALMSAAGELVLSLRTPMVLRGLVRDEVGTPIAGAQVRWRRRWDRNSEWQETLTTAADGGFETDQPRVGTPLVLEATGAGFAPAVAFATPQNAPPPVEITLPRGAEVRGRLVDPDDQAVTDAVLRFRRLGEDGSRLDDDQLNGAGVQPIEAGDDGRFESLVLAPGNYELEIEHEHLLPRENPAVRVEAADVPVDMGTLVLDLAAVIEVRVSDEAGRPIEGVDIGLLSSTVVRGNLYSIQGVTDAEGLYRSEKVVTGKSFDLRLTHLDYVNTRRSATAPTAEPIEVVMHEGIRLSGRVVTADGAPVPDAKVSASISYESATSSWSYGKFASSGPDGRFAISGVTAGDVRLQATAPGLNGGGLDFQVMAGGHRDGLVLVLDAGIEVVVRVSDEAGRSVAGAFVSLSRDDERRRSGKTGDDGTFVFENQRPGPATARAQHEERGSAVPFEGRLGPGPSTIDLVLVPRLVAGRVVTVTGEAVAQAEIVLTEVGGGMTTLTSHDDGRFVVFPRHAGQYELRAEKQGLFSETLSLDITDAPIRDLELILLRGTAIVGHILGIDGPQRSAVRVTAYPVDNISQGRFGTVDFEGRYRISGVAAGKWKVVANLAGSARAARALVEVGVNDDEVVSDLDLSAGDATVKGRLLANGQSAAGVFVSLGEPPRPASTTTNHAGEFRLEDLMPGSTKLAAWGEWGVYRTEVEIWDEREFVIDIPVRRVEGRVVSGDGEGLAGATLRLMGSPQAGRNIEARSDHQGHFELSAVEGPYRLNASAPGHAAAVLPVELVGLDAEGLEMVLAPSVPLVLDVVLASGEPVREVFLAALDGSGNLALTEAVKASEDGRLRAETVPPGSWQLLVISDRAAPQPLTVEVPGEAAVVLRPKTELWIQVPALADAGQPLRFSIADAEGRPLPYLKPFVDNLRIMDGELRFDLLPQGTWTIEVEASDGRRFRAVATTSEAAPTTLILE